MAYRHVSYKEESKLDYGKSRDDSPGKGCATHEQLIVGSLQRIADASELMASNYTALQENRDWWKQTANDRLARAEKAERRITALKGVITKMKRRNHATN